MYDHLFKETSALHSVCLFGQSYRLSSSSLIFTKMLLVCILFLLQNSTEISEFYHLFKSRTGKAELRMEGKSLQSLEYRTSNGKKEKECFYIPTVHTLEMSSICKERVTSEGKMQASFFSFLW